MYFVKYRGKLLLHSEICDFNSLIPEKQLDIKKDKSIVRKLFGKLEVTVSSKVRKIRRILKDLQSGQQTLPEILNGACNKALHFIRHGLLKVHKKTNTSIDYPEVELSPELEKLYSIQDFRGKLEHMFHVNNIDKLLLEAGFKKRDIPYFKSYASMIKRGHKTFKGFYTELEENRNLAKVVRFPGHVPNEKSFRRFRDDHASPGLEVLRDLLVKKLHDLNAISFRVVAIDGKFKRSGSAKSQGEYIQRYTSPFSLIPMPIQIGMAISRMRMLACALRALTNVGQGISI